jgi:hypothetical protein
MRIAVEDRIVSVGLGMLSWRAQRTLEHTLESYARADILSLFDEALIFFQEIGDREVAQQFGLRHAGSERNLGIYGGVRSLLEVMESDYVLSLENDCVLIEGREEVARQVEQAVRDIESGLAHVYRLRHRRQPGEGFHPVDKYRRYHPPAGPARGVREQLVRLAALLRRTLRPGRAERLKGLAVYFEDHPERRFPDVARRTAEGNLILSSRHLSWTNQSILFRRRWMLERVLPRVAAYPRPGTIQGHPSIERELNRSWWPRGDFRVGVTPGLFGHRRLDR